MRLKLTIEIAFAGTHEFDEEELRNQLGWRAIDAIMEVIDEVHRATARVGEVTVVAEDET